MTTGFRSRRILVGAPRFRTMSSNFHSGTLPGSLANPYPPKRPPMLRCPQEATVDSANLALALLDEADEKLLEREHRALRQTVSEVLRTPRGAKFLKQLYGVAFHDIYHAGQIRLLRRLMER